MAELAAPPNRLAGPLGPLLDAAPPSWRGVVQAWRHSPAGQALLAHVQQRLDAGATLYPAQPLLALALTPLPAVRVLILGQDPYHGPGQAQGMSFSVPAGQPRPPSLRNIDAELERDLKIVSTHSGDLTAWAQRGVLLLNTALTVEDGLPASHAGRGWEALTDALIDAVAAQAQPVAFLLWGKHAQAKAARVATGPAAAGPRLVLQANHPSPLSARRPPRPFIGCGHFGQVQQFLAAQGVALDWRRPGAQAAVL